MLVLHLDRIIIIIIIVSNALSNTRGFILLKLIQIRVRRRERERATLKDV